MSHAILLISCPDTKGITAAVTDFVFRHNGNIVHADQHIDEQSNTFFMRIEWDLEGFTLGREEVRERFSEVAARFAMTWDLHLTDQTVRVAVFVSKHLHCLSDLLYRQRAGQLPCEISCIISNHPDSRKLAQDHGISFHEIPIVPENKSEQEARQIAIVKEAQVEYIILARYHQILSKAFVNEFKNRIINIHHSFLPAFVGKRPYHQAHEKGVKIIGATSHFVTPELDQGPIIEQDTARVTHRDTLQDMVRKGEDLERMVLSRAVLWALERKILCYGNKTVVFD